VKPGILYHSYLMMALTKEAAVDKSIIPGRSSAFPADRLAVSP
jgi:hypothetical protein